MRNVLLISIPCVVLATGCCQWPSKCCLNNPDCKPKPYQPPAPGAPILLPPANVPTTGVPPAPPPGSVVPSVAPSGYPPPVLNTTPSPSLKPPPEVLFPDPLPGGPSSRAPSPANSGFGVVPSVPRQPVATTPEPPIVPAVMTGVPGFARLPDGLASGRKPDLDGFASLKKAGYRTVIYLYPAGADVSPVRELAGKRELGFIGIETTPERLKASLEAFNSTLADKSIRPIYVFDDDGVRAGTMWYLHFRSARAMNDDAARVMAKPLGLTDQGSEAQAFEVAIQKYLSER